MELEHMGIVILSDDQVELSGHKCTERRAEAERMQKAHVPGFDAKSEFDYSLGNIQAGMAMCQLRGVDYTFHSNLYWASNSPLFEVIGRKVLVRTSPIDPKKTKKIWQHELPLYDWEMNDKKVKKEIRVYMVGKKHIWMPAGWIISKNGEDKGQRKPMYSGSGVFVNIKNLNTLTKNGKFKNGKFKNSEYEDEWENLPEEIRDAIEHPYKLLKGRKLYDKFREYFT